LIPGYSVVGRVSETGSEVRGWRKGDLVSGRNPLPVPDINSLWGAQASHHRYKITGYDRPVKLPPGVQPWDFVTAEVAAISWRAVTAAVEMIHRGHLKVADFADIPVPFSDAPQAYAELRDHPDRRSSLVFRWTDR